MQIVQRTLAALLCCALPLASFAADGYQVTYSVGSLPIEPGRRLRLFIADNEIRLSEKALNWVRIDTASVKELSFGEESRHRIGEAVGLAPLTLGISALFALSKEKTHFIGVVWESDSKDRGAISLRADKRQYKIIIEALERATRQKAIDADAKRTAP